MSPRTVNAVALVSTLLFACGGGTFGVNDAGTDGGGTDGAMTNPQEGGSCHGVSGVIHRTQAETCASNAGADAGCNVVPHDQCVADSDCGANSDCLCEGPPLAGQNCPGGVSLPAGNVCIPANCRVDTDCSLCGVCQAEYSCGEITGYYCQTPTDECVPAGPAMSYDGNGCVFKSGRWTSSGAELCPG